MQLPFANEKHFLVAFHIQQSTAKCLHISLNFFLEIMNFIQEWVKEKESPESYKGIWDYNESIAGKKKLLHHFHIQ